MTVLFDGELPVHHGYVYLRPAGDDPADGFGTEGQNNGLCGVPVPDQLTVMTATHTGRVPVTVQALQTSPEMDGSWEEIVEVSLVVAGTEYELSTFDDRVALDFPSRGIMRVRLQASGMVREDSVDPKVGVPSGHDRYLIVCWPDEALRPDEIVRSTSSFAMLRHHSARTSQRPT